MLRPRNRGGAPLPVLIVPFYDVDIPAAEDLGGRRFAPGRNVNAFAYTAAQHGYIAVQSAGSAKAMASRIVKPLLNLADPSPRRDGTRQVGRGRAPALWTLSARCRTPTPRALGSWAIRSEGRWPSTQRQWILGFAVVVSSELGVGFRMSNYDDYWYLGDTIAKLPAGTDQHELIGMLAPRPFLLIGGDQFDKAESWYYINAAREVYRIYDVPQNIGYLNHHTGHTPTPDAVAAGFAWLDRFLGFCCKCVELIW